MFCQSSSRHWIWLRDWSSDVCSSDLAEVEDAAALIEVWDLCDVADHDPDDPHLPASARQRPSVAEAADALSEQIADPDRRVLVAVRDGDVVGAIAFRRQLVSVIQTEKIIVITDLHVLPRHRRRLIASSLISAGVRWAEDVNCEVMMGSEEHTSELQSRGH